MKILQNKKLINIAINTIVIAVFIATIIPFFITTKYALFVTDDFPIANATVRNFDGNYFRTGIKCAANYWHVWNGNWFSFFVAYAAHPLVHGGQQALVVALRIHLVLTITGVVYFCVSLVKFFGLKLEKTSRIIALVVLPVLFFKEYFDFYLWWLTSCTYLMPLYLFLWGFGTFLFAIKSEKVWQYTVAGILLFLMSGGSLNVVGMGCYSLFFTLVVWCTYRKKVVIPAIVVFAITLLGACINAFAPGNFVRQDGQETEKLGIFRTMLTEVKIMGVEGKWLILHTAFLAFLFLGILWGGRLNKRISLRNLIFATIGCIALPLVTMFPVILGYGDITYKDVSNRGYGMMDISIIFASAFMAVLWGIYLKDIVCGKVKAVGIIGMSAVALISVIVCGQNFTELVPVQIYTNLNNGYNVTFFNAWMEIFSLCENGENDDIVVTLEVPPRKAGCSWAKLSDDTTKWWNEEISEYYGLNSLSLINIFEEVN